jgi:tetratricopeptide (TPR) repeat protein/transcriptional regulator with XRE-family HTH domain
MAVGSTGPPLFGQQLRRLRSAAGLTQEALAERSGVSVDAISALENGRRHRPRPDTVLMLAEGLGLESDERERLAAAGRGQGRQSSSKVVPEARAEPPEPRAGIPPDQIALFVGRERELAALVRQLKESGRVAVHGLGGIGKTQLVVRFLHQHSREYPDGVFWVRADRETSLVGDLAGLTWRLGLPEREEPEQKRQIEAVLRWLREHRRWLLVLDNFEPTVAETVRHWLPPGLQGHLLLTSRTPTWSVRLCLGPLPPGIASYLLLQRTGQADGDAADAVAETLGHLPLALTQAAAFLEASGRDLASYAGLLRTRLVELMEEGTPEDYPRPVASTLRLSFERMENERPAAAALLRLCAFLAPDSIPISVLRGGAGEVPEELRHALGDGVEFDRTIATLRHYSLAERQGGGLRVHRLVQAVVRESLAAEQQKTWLAAAIRTLQAGFPAEAVEHPAQWPLCACLLAHIQVVERLTEDRMVEPAALGRLLHQLGRYLRLRGEFALARPLLARALAIREQVLGPGHAATAECLNSLASLLQDEGDLAAARPLFERSLTIRERVLGSDDAETAVSLNNLGLLLKEQGELAAARPLLERSLAIWERVLGPVHRRTGAALNNLGLLLKEQGELAAARALFERSLAIDEEVTGPDHPRTAISLNNLGNLLREEGDLATARTLLDRAVLIVERVLVPDHPHVARSLHNLALVVRDEGDLTTASLHLQRALATFERVLGPEHRWTIESRRAFEGVTSNPERHIGWGSSRSDRRTDYPEDSTIVV